MKNLSGKFSVEEAFIITGRGWVLAGEVRGETPPIPGNQLVFESGIVLRISGVEIILKRSREQFGLLIYNHFASRQELIDQHIIGATAQIVE